MLEVRGVDVKYGDVQVLWDINLSVGPGEVVAVMGPNGSGKSTILKAIIGLVRSAAGTITLDGRSIAGQPAHASWSINDSGGQRRRVARVGESLRGGVKILRTKRAGHQAA